MHPMGHAVQERLVGCQLIARSKQSQRSPMGRWDQMIPRVASRPRCVFDDGARNPSVDRVVLCEAPNDRGRMRE
jgi:hypothetical protein